MVARELIMSLFILCAVFPPNPIPFSGSCGNNLLQVVLEVGFNFHWIQQSLEKVLSWKESKQALLNIKTLVSSFSFLTTRCFVTKSLDQWLKVETYCNKSNFSWFRNVFLDNVSTDSIVVWYFYSNAIGKTGMYEV